MKTFFMRIIRRLISRPFSFAKTELGSASIEFVILFPLIFTFFFLSVELGLINLRNTYLVRAVDLTVRDLRLGRLVGATHDSLKTEICSKLAIFPDCIDNLMIELRPISKVTWAMPSPNAQCVDRSEEIQPVTTINIGAPDELMLIRVCAVLDPMFPTTGLGLALNRVGTGEIFLVSSSIFVNEP